MENEEWRDVPGYEGLYAVNINSQVKSLHARNRNGILPQRIDRGGYYTVKLSKRGKDSTQYVHRILALAYLRNDKNKCCVNHRNGQKLQNNIENLEWVTYAENSKHAILTGLSKIPSKSSRQVYDTETNQYYPNMRQAAKAKGKSYLSFKKSIKEVKMNNTGCVLVE